MIGSTSLLNVGAGAAGLRSGRRGNQEADDERQPEALVSFAIRLMERDLPAVLP